MRMMLLAAMTLGAPTSAALAEEPLKLTEAQMDSVTAGQDAQPENPNGLAEILSAVATSAPGYIG